jgi:hypothetical protein
MSNALYVSVVGLVATVGLADLKGGEERKELVLDE